MEEPFWSGFQDWQERTTEAWTQVIRSPEFIKLMNSQLEWWLTYKSRMDQAAQEAAQAAGLATRADGDATLGLVRQLEQRVEELEERIEHLTQMLPPEPGGGTDGYAPP